MTKKHKCPDGTIYKWETRVANPKSCPKCKAYLKQQTTGQRLDKQPKDK